LNFLKNPNHSCRVNSMSLNLPAAPENSTLPQPSVAPLNAPEHLSENPAWNGWDVVRVFVFAVAMLIAFLIGTALVAKLILFPSMKFMTVMTFPLVTFVAQVLAYLVLFAFMVRVAKRGSDASSFGAAIRWNWPTRGTGWLVLTGLITYVALIGMVRFLPWPKKSPFDEFFKHPIDAYAVAVLAITLGPLMEE